MPVESGALLERAMNWQSIAFASICGRRRFARLNCSATSH